MEALLGREVLARERKNKNRAIAHVLKERWPTALKDVPKDKLISIVKQANTLDRAWRKVTETRKDLRGKDYGGKAEAEHDVKNALGYGSSYPNDTL